jgi:hypothetical protein
MIDGVSILDERELTEAERAAIADEARPGVWVEEHEIFSKVNDWPLSRRTGRTVEIKSQIEIRGDGRVLDQHETDLLIVTGLHRHDDFEQKALVEVVGWPVAISFDCFGSFGDQQQAFEQRGGIHSDPLVRLLAVRAWGDRDRTWRKRDTARALIAGRGLLGDSELDTARRVYGWRGLSILGSEFTANLDDERTATVTFQPAKLPDNRTFAEYIELALDTFDEIDAKLLRGEYDPPSEGPSFSFDAPAPT